MVGGGRRNGARFPYPTALDGGYSSGSAFRREPRADRGRRRVLAGCGAVEGPADCRKLEWRRSVAARGFGRRVRGTRTIRARASVFLGAVVDHDGSLRRRTRQSSSRSVGSCRPGDHQVAASSTDEGPLEGRVDDRMHPRLVRGAGGARRGQRTGIRSDPAGFAVRCNLGSR